MSFWQIASVFNKNDEVITKVSWDFQIKRCGDCCNGVGKSTFISYFSTTAEIGEGLESCKCRFIRTTLGLLRQGKGQETNIYSYNKRKHTRGD